MDLTALPAFGSVALGIRRRVKYKEERDKKNISLLRFLTEVKKYPELISRQYYLELYKAKNAPLVLGEGDFDKLAGPGNAYLPPTLEAVINFSAVFSADYRVNCAIDHCDKLYRWNEKPVPVT
jgi:hypothetical protein